MAGPSYIATMSGSAIVNAWRHRTMTVITVLIVSLMITTLGMFLIVENALSVMIASMEERVNLIIDLVDDAPPSDVLALRQQLLDDPRVIDVGYITPEEALERLRPLFKDEPDLLLPLISNRNPLPASLEVRSDDPNHLLSLASLLAVNPIVKEVTIPKDVLDNVIRIVQVIRFLGYTLGAGLALVALFVIGSTIRLTVYARRGEIEVLRLMGASDHFIRWPFLLEGVFFGLVGALFSSLVVGVAYLWVHELLQQLISFFPVSVDITYLLRLLLTLTLFGIVIGGFGSYLSVRRFLTI